MPGACDQTCDHSLAVVLEDGSHHKSPSAADSKVMGGKVVNGWRFWSVEGTAQAKAEKPEKQASTKTPGGSRGPRKATKSSASKKAKTTATLFRMKDQENVPDGKVLWFCRGCMDGFFVEGEDEPTTCPQGHSNDDPELNAPAGLTAAQEAAGV